MIIKREVIKKKPAVSHIVISASKSALTPHEPPSVEIPIISIKTKAIGRYIREKRHHVSYISERRNRRIREMVNVTKEKKTKVKIRLSNE